MSFFDGEEVLAEAAKSQAIFLKNEDLSWDKFHNEMIAPRLKKLIDRKPIGKFAVGVYVPTDPAYEYGVASSIESLCDKIKPSIVISFNALIKSSLVNFAILIFLSL